MDAGSTGRPVASATAAQPRLDSLPARPSVHTDIAPEKAVAAVPGASDVQLDVSAQARRDLEAREALRHVIEKHAVYDDQNRTVVVENRSRATGYVLNQYPDAAILKLRAYVRELAAKSNRAKQSPQQDTEGGVTA